MPELAAGSPVYGQDFPPSQFDQDWTQQADLSQFGTFSVGSPEVAVLQVAPRSGKIFVAIAAGIRNQAATVERGEVTFHVHRDGPDGILVQSAFAAWGVKSNGVALASQFQYVGNFSLIEDLDPGVAYHFQVVHRSVAGQGTIDIASRSIMTIPVP